MRRPVNLPEGLPHAEGRGREPVGIGLFVPNMDAGLRLLTDDVVACRLTYMFLLVDLGAAGLTQLARSGFASPTVPRLVQHPIESESAQPRGGLQGEACGPSTSLSSVTTGPRGSISAQI